MSQFIRINPNTKLAFTQKELEIQELKRQAAEYLQAYNSAIENSQKFASNTPVTSTSNEMLRISYLSTMEKIAQQYGGAGSLDDVNEKDDEDDYDYEGINDENEDNNDKNEGNNRKKDNLIVDKKPKEEDGRVNLYNSILGEENKRVDLDDSISGKKSEENKKSGLDYETVPKKIRYEVQRRLTEIDKEAAEKQGKADPDAIELERREKINALYSIDAIRNYFWKLGLAKSSGVMGRMLSKSPLGKLDRQTRESIVSNAINSFYTDNNANVKDKYYGGKLTYKDENGENKRILNIRALQRLYEWRPTWTDSNGEQHKSADPFEYLASSKTQANILTSLQQIIKQRKLETSSNVPSGPKGDSSIEDTLQAKGKGGLEDVLGKKKNIRWDILEKSLESNAEKYEDNMDKLSYLDKGSKEYQEIIGDSERLQLVSKILQPVVSPELLKKFNIEPTHPLYKEFPDGVGRVKNKLDLDRITGLVDEELADKVDKIYEDSISGWLNFSDKVVSNTATKNDVASARNRYGREEIDAGIRMLKEESMAKTREKLLPLIPGLSEDYFPKNKFWYSEALVGDSVKNYPKVDYESVMDPTTRSKSSIRSVWKWVVLKSFAETKDWIDYKRKKRFDGVNYGGNAKDWKAQDVAATRSIAETASFILERNIEQEPLLQSDEMKKIIHVGNPETGERSWLSRAIYSISEATKKEVIARMTNNFTGEMDIMMRGASYEYAKRELFPDLEWGSLDLEQQKKIAEYSFNMLYKSGYRRMAVGREYNDYPADLKNNPDRYIEVIETEIKRICDRDANNKFETGSNEIIKKYFPKRQKLLEEDPRIPSIEFRIFGDSSDYGLNYDDVMHKIISQGLLPTHTRYDIGAPRIAPKLGKKDYVVFPTNHPDFVSSPRNYKDDTTGKDIPISEFDPTEESPNMPPGETVPSEEQIEAESKVIQLRHAERLVRVARRCDAEGRFALADYFDKYAMQMIRNG